jgi:hypothetical protein
LARDNDIQTQIAIDQIVHPPQVPVSDEELTKIIEEIDSAQILLDQRLLRESEFTDISSRAKNAYENTADHNSIQYRKYDKSRRDNTIWREVTTSGYVQTGSGWNFNDIRQQIVELLDLKGNPAPSPKELFLPPNSEFDARLNIRNILSGATTSIDIKDDYLFTVNNKTKNVDILYILSPYLTTSLDIKVRLLGSEKELPSSISDINAFLNQYKEKIGIRGVGLNDSNQKETHDRFIVIDNKSIFQIGASIKDLGKAQSSIIAIDSEDVRQQYINQFEEWWKVATPYTIDES